MFYTYRFKQLVLKRGSWVGLHHIRPWSVTAPRWMWAHLQPMLFISKDFVTGYCLLQIICSMYEVNNTSVYFLSLIMYTTCMKLCQ